MVYCSNMTYNTKYNIGDKFWTMINNQATETKITDIFISSCEEKSDTSVVRVDEISYRFSRQKSGYSVPEKEIKQFFFRTKKALLASL